MPEDAALILLRQVGEAAAVFNDRKVRDGMILMAHDVAGRRTLEKALADFQRWLPVLQTTNRELVRAAANISTVLRKRGSLRA